MPLITRKGSVKKFAEYTEGVRIASGLKLRPAPYLPVVKYDTEMKRGIVLEAGTIVSLDQFGYVVPANGGVDSVFNYTVLDVAEGVYDITTFTNKKTDARVAAPAEAVPGLRGNKPLGVVFRDYHVWDMQADPSYQMDLEVTILADWMILVALSGDYDSSEYLPGTLIVPDSTGWYVPLAVSSISDAIEDVQSAAAAIIANISAALEQVVGRVVKVIDLEADPTWTGGYEKVITVPGLGLPGMENGGVLDGMDPVTKKAAVIQLNI